MFKLFIEFLEYICSNIPLISTVSFLTLIFLILYRSIKKYAIYYYIVFSIPCILVLGLDLVGVMGFETPSLRGVPVLGRIISNYVHMAGFGFPLLIIIMYMGALNTKNKYVRKLMNMRKEISIMSGFPILTHATMRVFYTFPRSWRFFMNNDAYIADNSGKSIGTGDFLYNLGYVLGVLLVALFLVLWITSFDSIHKRMGQKMWKKVQRWSYGLYALLFIHFVLLHAGWMLSRGMAEANSDYVRKEIIALISIALIFGSYLILRLRKANSDTKRVRQLAMR